MGRLSKIKRELIQESNKRLLSEQQHGITDKHCWNSYNGIPCSCGPIYPHTSHEYGGNGTHPQYGTMAQCWNDTSNCCNDKIYGVKVRGCRYYSSVTGGMVGGNDWGFFNMKAKINGQLVQPSDVGTKVLMPCCFDENGNNDDEGWEGCCEITGVEIWEPPNYFDNHAILNLTIDNRCCISPMRYTCKGPLKQPTSTKATTDVSIKERVTKSPLTSHCEESEIGEFATLQACKESCEAGYGPGYEPDAGTAEG